MDQDRFSFSPEQETSLQEILGYLNFSNGTPDTKFERNLNDFFSLLVVDEGSPPLYPRLKQHLEKLRGESPAFRDSDQAAAVLELVFEQVLPAYRKFHADLMFHLPASAFLQPLFIARLCEATLGQGGPWTETERIVEGALGQLNDFLGHRPVAVLENGRLSLPYPHERHRPVPLFIRGVGPARGKFHDVIAKALEILAQTPPEILSRACFSFDQLEEIALDVRAYDQSHPAYKRTNYSFGEWDPYQINTKGFFRRFVLRAIILDALEDWLKSVSRLPAEETIMEAGAVLAGTMLMAAVVSGSGPDTHDSSVSLMSLLPQIARQRDAYYQQLLQSLSGPHADRLRLEAQQTQQPLGKTRQHLNLFLAHYGCRQMQRSQLAYLYARMGYPVPARAQAAVIPAAATRIETEIQIQLVLGHLELDRGELTTSAERLPAIEDLLHRGIGCGALVDPWNILGFSGHFPLFNTREDAIYDQRVDKLLGLMEQLFALSSRWLCEAAAAGEQTLSQSVGRNFRRMAEEWDRYATTTITDLPAVSGQESFDSASHVAAALSDWSRQGESAGDIAFWKRYVGEFQSPKAYAMVLDVLLRRDDTIATMNLLIQWLSQHELVPLEAGPYSIYPHMEQWLSQVLESARTSSSLSGPGEEPQEQSPQDRIWSLLTRFFDVLEVNAGDLWAVPQLDDETGKLRLSPGADPEMISDDSELDDLFTRSDESLSEDSDDQEDESEKSLFSAAYEGVTFRESAQDGHEGDTLDSGPPDHDSDLDMLSQPVEARLRFFLSMMQMWRTAAFSLRGEAHPFEDGARQETLLRWYRRNEIWLRDLQKLLERLSAYEPLEPMGDPDSLGEYDRQLHVKFHLMNGVLSALVSSHETARLFRCWLPEQRLPSDTRSLDRKVARLYRLLLAGDATVLRRELPQFLRDLERKPLLYVPLDRGGKPRECLAARNLQSLIRLLLSTLPRLGLFRETWHVLRTAYVMERTSPPVGTSVTEFDRLLEAGLRASLEALLENATGWEQQEKENISAERLVELARDVTEMYTRLWLKHAATMRLSSVEFLSETATWRRVRQFIKKYGAELFPPGVLSGGNLRAIVHRGPEAYLDYLVENQDPLKPLKFLEDLGTKIERDDAAYLIDLIFRCVVEKFERYMEYNTTTTQSDYGEQLYTLLDFLRVEAAYERNAWNVHPLVLAHEVLARNGRSEAAAHWEKMLAKRTSEFARKHLQQLRVLEKRHSIRLPSITDQLNERFVKPMALDRMLALVKPAMQEALGQKETSTPAPDQPLPAAEGNVPGTVFERFQREVETYLETSSGSALELQPWLQDLVDEVHAVEADIHDGPAPRTDSLPVPFRPILIAALLDQLSQWEKPLSPAPPSTPA